MSYIYQEKISPILPPGEIFVCKLLSFFYDCIKDIVTLILFHLVKFIPPNISILLGLANSFVLQNFSYRCMHVSIL